VLLRLALGIFATSVMRIAFIRGTDHEFGFRVRWDAICEVAQQLGMRIRPELTIQLEGFDSTPGIGYSLHQTTPG